MLHVLQSQGLVLKVGRQVFAGNPEYASQLVFLKAALCYPYKARVLAAILNHFHETTPREE